ncbi:MAG: hypothetical protein P3A28_02320 [Gemmatimonadota bacterium]|nr:hypothetical protein [Gemmatimonadota bacterium]
MKAVLHRFSLVGVLAAAAACSSATPPATPAPATTPDPRVGLKAGLMNAGEAVAGMKVTAKAVSPPGFLGITNSDLAFTGKYAIQGNYNGPVIWDVSNPNNPVMVTAYTCPASQNDVSVYKNLMFVSAEAFNGRLDCGTGGTGAAQGADSVNAARFRGVRVFDISDITKPKLVANVQTCRGSHTHTVLEHPSDKDNVYIYVSGSAGVRPAGELARCTAANPATNQNSSLMKIEIIKVPLTNPAASAVVNSANIFVGLTAPATHGAAPDDIAGAARALAAAKASGGFTATNPNTGAEMVVNPNALRPVLDSIAKAAGRAGAAAATAADSAALRPLVQGIINRALGGQAPVRPGVSPNSPGRQCHDITVYPARGLAGGACEGHGFLLDISDPVNPIRLDAVADSNFSYWHSATFNNDGTKLLFSDEWGGGGGPRCRASDPKEWGANAIFTIENRKLKFQSYYKLPAAQTANENCVAHNGSLIPIPGRDVMVQAWYQGGISVFDWTDAAKPKEIAFFDRGPIDSTRMQSGGSWSVYWYNGAIVSSEIARGLDVADLIPTEHVSQNEIDAAKTVRWDYLNAQGQPDIKWPPSFALAKALLDQLERNKCLSAQKIANARAQIGTAEQASGQPRNAALSSLAASLGGERASCDQNKITWIAQTLRDIQNVVIP